MNPRVTPYDIKQKLKFTGIQSIKMYRDVLGNRAFYKFEFTDHEETLKAKKH